jgi:hypothetical protein
MACQFIEFLKERKLQSRDDICVSVEVAWVCKESSVITSDASRWYLKDYFLH